MSPIPNWHISSHWMFPRKFGRTDINKMSTSVSPVETNSFLNPFLAQFMRCRMILWSASSMSQFEILSSAIMFSLFVSIESLHVTTKCFWNIGVPTNCSAKYTCRSFLLSLFIKKLLLKSPGIFVSSLECFLEPSPLLDWIFYFKLFLKYGSTITSSQATWTLIQDSLS